MGDKQHSLCLYVNTHPCPKFIVNPPEKLGQGWVTLSHRNRLLIHILIVIYVCKSATRSRFSYCIAMQYAHGFVMVCNLLIHNNDVIILKHFTRYWLFVREIHIHHYDTLYSKFDLKLGILFSFVWLSSVMYLTFPQTQCWPVLTSN